MTVSTRLMTLGIIAALSVGLAMIPLSAWAKPARCDETVGGRPEDKPLKTCELKLNDAQDDLLNEMEDLADVLAKTPGVNISSMRYVDSSSGEEGALTDHLGRMRRQQEEAKDVIDESEESEFEDMVIHGGKKKGQKCEWKEADEVKDRPEDYLPSGLTNASAELGNKECDRFLAYDEDKRRDVWISERSQPNICVRVCGDSEVLDTSPDQFSVSENEKKKKKDKIQNRHVERRSEGIDSSRKAENAISLAKADLETLNVLSETFGPAYAVAAMFPECALPDDKVQHDRWLAKEILVPILILLKINSRVAEGVQDSAWAICQQTVAGVNASVTCVPAILYKQISLGLVDAMDFVIDEIDLAMQGFDLTYSDVTHECVTSIRQEQATMMRYVKATHGDVQALTTKVGDIEEGLKKLIEENREYIKNTREIVLTPHGRRDRVPLYEPPRED